MTMREAVRHERETEAEKVRTRARRTLTRLKHPSDPDL